MKTNTSTLSANMFGCNGKIATNPKYLIYRQDRQNTVFGDFSLNASPQELLEWLVMQTEGIPFGKVGKWCETHNPRLCIFDVKRNEESVYSYDNARIGVQMYLFNMKGIQ